MQVGVLAVIPLVLLTVTAWCSRKAVSSDYVGLLALATGTAFGMGLSALGGILNLAPSPHALCAWGGFALLAGYATGFRLLLGCALVLLAAYAGAVGTAAGGVFWGSFMERPVWVLPAAALLYGVPVVVRHPPGSGFDLVYQACGAGLGLLALLILSLGGDVCCTVSLAPTVTMLYQLAGLGVSVAVVAHGLRLGRGGLVNLGAAGFVVFLVFRLHAWWWDWMPKYLFCLCLGLTAVVLLVLFRRVRRQLAGTDRSLAPKSEGQESDLRGGNVRASAEAGQEQPALALSRDAAAERRFREHGWMPAPWLWTAAAVLIVAANLGAVLSGWRNRSATPGGTVELTERELTLPTFFEDSTVLLLDLEWAAFPSDPPDERAAGWLTSAKLEELGFDCREPITSPHAPDHYGAMLPRSVYVVLEFEGDAGKEMGRQRALRTHLFAVDAGRDPAVLRAKHPQASRHVIARALVRPWVRTLDPISQEPLAVPRLSARIQELQPGLIFVPRPYSTVLEGLRHRPTAGQNGPHTPPRYAVTVSWGAHHEPWVRSVRLLASDAQAGPGSNR